MQLWSLFFQGEGNWRVLHIKMKPLHSNGAHVSKEVSNKLTGNKHDDDLLSAVTS